MHLSTTCRALRGIGRRSFLLASLVAVLAFPVHADDTEENAVVRFSGQGRYAIVGNGVGMQSSSSGNFTLNVPGTVVKAYLYWSGYDSNNSGDNQVKLKVDSGSNNTINAETTYGPKHWFGSEDRFVWVKEVTSIVQSGNHTYTVSEFSNSMTLRDGAGLIVVYEDNNLPINQVKILDTLDRIYHGFSGARGEEAVHSATLDPVSAARTMDYTVLVGGIDISGGQRPNALWHKTGTGTIPTNIIDTNGAVHVNNSDYLFTSSSGAEFDVFSSSLTVPADNTWVGFQAESVSDVTGFPSGAPSVSKLRKFLVIAMGHDSDVGRAFQMSNSEIGANRDVLSNSSDPDFSVTNGSFPNLLDVFDDRSNGGSNNRWDVSSNPDKVSVMDNGNLEVISPGEVIDYSGDAALTSSGGKFDFSNSLVWADKGIQGKKSNPRAGSSNSKHVDLGETTQAQSSNMSNNNGYQGNKNHSTLISHLASWRSFLRGKSAEKTITSLSNFQNNEAENGEIKGTPGKGLITTYDSSDDTNNDGFVIIDVNPNDEFGDFSLTNLDWAIIANDGVVPIFRLRQGSNMLMSNVSILVDNDGNYDLGAIFLSAYDGSGSGDTVFNGDNLILNRVGFWDLNVAGQGGSTKTEININNAQGCAQFIAQKVNFQNNRWVRCTPGAALNGASMVFIGVGTSTAAGASLGDFVWDDTNRNGIQDNGEAGVANVTATLFKNGVATGDTDVTDNNGEYGFTDLEPGNYHVVFSNLPSGKTFTSQNQGGDDALDSDADPNTGATPAVTLALGDDNSSLDAGVASPIGSIGDFVWVDQDNDGVQDPGETGLNGVTVRLLDPNNNNAVLQTTTTANGGAYVFNNLAPGDYVVEFVLPNGHVFSPKDQGGDDTKDSDANVSTGRTATITLAANEDNTSVDAGLVPATASLGDFVWLDADKDGIQDGGESGVQGVTATLFKDEIATGDTDVTDNNGAYSFTNLAPGDYHVVFSNLPANTAFTTADQGGDDALDSDANTSTGKTGVVTLAVGGNNSTLDAGLVSTLASLGDFVWVDSNNNGVQDNGETGLSGVTVRLLDPGNNNATLQTTTTGPGGAYLFNNLNPGNYVVEFVLPNGYGFSPQNQGGDDAVDSDPNPSNGRTASITLVSGQDDLSADAGLVPATASLGDFVWLDADKDGIQDNGESGVQSVTVTLFKDEIATGDTDVTDNNGAYSFTNLAPGDYHVVFSNLPANTAFTTADQGGDDALDSDANTSTGKTGVVTLAVGGNNTTLDAGLISTLSSLGDFVWVDSNNNGVQDNGETGLSGVTVRLLDPGNNNATLATTTTGQGGSYLFDDLAPGNYVVEFVLPNGYGFSPQNQGGDDAVDSDANPSTGRTASITLASNEDNTSVDAGLVPATASLGDFVWLDDNKDGIQDNNESGVQGVTVTLFKDEIATGDTDVTDNNGAYSFTNLAPGDYHVVFSNLPANTAFTTADQGGDDALDSDANTSTGKTGVVTLAVGGNNTTLDAGLISTLSSLGDFVWVDSNNNGVQDNGETGLSGVTVRLLDPGNNNATLATTTTGQGGSYLFGDLTPGNYVVEFVLPSGYVFSPQDQGGNDNADSDANTSTGRTASITLASNEDNTSVDAGLVTTNASLGDFVWLDDNRDGVQDNGEAGVQGVTVTLFRNGNATGDTDVTDNNGAYGFMNLAPGDYHVVFSNLPANTAFTTANQGGDDAVDSDANTSTGVTAAVTLGVGGNNTTLDAGLVSTLSSLGDFVWVDSNNNGVQDNGEAGLSGVTVRLLDPNNNNSVLETTTTGPGGAYLFDDLVPGGYVVEFVLPNGYVFSPQDQGGDDTQDSDANTSTGRTGTITLAASQNNLDADAGLVATSASLGDFVWLDADKDGIQDNGEAGVENVTVTLFKDEIATGATDVTDANGAYSFTNLAPGDYHVVFSNLPANTAFTTADQGGDDALDSDANTSTGKTGVVTLGVGGNNTTLDAGLVSTLSSLGDFVWVDSNNNGEQDNGETGLSGVTVRLLDPNDNNNVLETTTTGQGGSYLFDDLTPGDYVVEFVLPNGYVFSPQDQGGDDTQDSDANTSTGRTGTITLAASQNNLDADAGLVATSASLGDFVWLDADKDGIQDNGEAGVENVTVTLFKDGNATGQTDQTDSNGAYSFTNLAPGDYHVVFSNLPANTAFTTADQGSDDAVDSDANTSTGVTAAVTLGVGGNNTTLDAGLVSTLGSLGDFVWIDTDNDGVQDNGEAGLDGVTVRLLDPNDNNNVLETTTTSGGGAYLFDDLIPGDYVVEFVRPNGYVFSPQDQGGDNTLDSDANTSTGRTGTITLAASQNNLDADAGLVQTNAALGNFVWYDLDLDGIQDNGEPGVENVTVNLLDPNDSFNQLGTTTTNGNGEYGFNNLTPGDYVVEFELPTRHKFTSRDQGSDDTVDSDSNTSSGRTSTVTLASGDSNQTLDAGLFPQVSPVLECVRDNGNGTFTASFGYLNEAAVAFTYPVGSNNSFNPAPQDRGQPTTFQPGRHFNAFNITANNGTNLVWNVTGKTATAGSGSAACALADLELEKVVDDATPAINTNVEFTLTLANNGPYANSFPAQVTDVLPAGLTYVSHTLTPNTGSYDQNTGLWSFDTQNGTPLELKIVATATQLGSIKNCAQVTNAAKLDSDSDPANDDGDASEDDESCATINVSANRIDLSLAKVVDDPAPSVGDAVTYSVTVTNSGNISATGIEVVDTLPAGVSFGSFTQQPGGATENNGVITWTPPDMGYPGCPSATCLPSSFTLIYTGTITGSGTLQNCAEVTAADQTDLDSTPNNGDTLEDDHACASVTTNGSSGGGVAGVESNGDAAADLATRLFHRRQDVQEQEALMAAPEPVFFNEASTAMFAVAKTGAAFDIAQIISNEGPQESEAFVTTPRDILFFTNATSVFAADYFRPDGARVGALFGATSPATALYDHTKVTCDRLGGAQLVNVRTVEVQGRTFVMSEHLHADGQLDYAITFVAYRSGDTFSVDSRFVPDSYELQASAEEIINMQVWTVSADFTIDMVDDILTKLSEQGSVSYVNEGENEPQLPYIFVSGGTYTNGVLSLQIANLGEDTEVTITGTTGQTETSTQSENRTPFIETVFVPSSSTDEPFTTIALDMGSLYDIGFTVETTDGMVHDRAYYADGPWGFAQGNAAISSFETSPVDSSLINTPSTDFRVERNATLTGDVTNWVSLFRYLRPNGVAVDLTGYKNIEFTAYGFGNAQLFVEKASILDGNQYGFNLRLNAQPTRYTIPLEDLRQVTGNAGFTPEDVTALVYYVVGNGRTSEPFFIVVEDVRFTGKTSGVSNETEDLDFEQPETFTLEQNYPNPFNPQTTIGFALPNASDVELTVYDMLGRQVAVLVRGALPSGRHQVVFDAGHLASGTYIYRLQASGVSLTKTLVLLK